MTLPQQIDQLLSFFQNWKVKDCQEDLQKSILRIVQDWNNEKIETAIKRLPSVDDASISWEGLCWYEDKIEDYLTEYLEDWDECA